MFRHFRLFRTVCGGVCSAWQSIRRRVVFSARRQLPQPMVRNNTRPWLEPQLGSPGKSGADLGRQKTYHDDLVSGLVPDGMTFSNGVFSGTPSPDAAELNENGLYTNVVRVADSFTDRITGRATPRVASVTLNQLVRLSLPVHACIRTGRMRRRSPRSASSVTGRTFRRISRRTAPWPSFMCRRAPAGNAVPSSTTSRRGIHSPA